MPSGATLERRVESMRKRLATGGEVARHVLRELLPRRIWLQPDESGKFLWAEFQDGLRSALFDQLMGLQYSDPQGLSARRKVGVYGSGGLLPTLDQVPGVGV
jgi:DNA-binding transcriptional MocR family regulator